MSLILLGILNSQVSGAAAQNYYFSYDGNSSTSTQSGGYAFSPDNKLIGYLNDGPSGDVGMIIQLDGAGAVVSRTDYRSNVVGGDNRSRIRDFGKYDGIEYAVITDETTGNSDPNIVKFTSGGAIDWQRSIGLGTGGSNNVIPTFLTVDSSGNVYTAMIAYPQQLVITKHNSSGTLQWQKYLDDASLEVSQPSCSLSTDSSGNLYVMCWSISSTYGSLMSAIKLDSSGAIQWQKYGEWPDDSPYTVGIADSSGNVYLTCRAQIGASFTDWAMPLVKYNSSGTLQWTTYLNLGTSTGLVDQTTTPVIDSSGNIIVIAEVSTLQGFLIASFDSSGTLNWQRTVECGAYRPVLFETPRASIDENDNVRFAYRFFDSTDSTNGFGGVVFPANGDFIGTYTDGSQSWVVSASSATQTTGSGFTERSVSLSATNSSLTETSGRIEAFSSSDFTLKVLEA